VAAYLSYLASSRFPYVWIETCLLIDFTLDLKVNTFNSVQKGNVKTHQGYDRCQLGKKNTCRKARRVADKVEVAEDQYLRLRQTLELKSPVHHLVLFVCHLESSLLYSSSLNGCIHS